MARHQVWDEKGNLILDKEQPEPEISEIDKLKDEIANLKARIEKLEGR